MAPPPELLKLSRTPSPRRSLLADRPLLPRLDPAETVLAFKRAEFGLLPGFSLLGVREGRWPPSLLVGLEGEVPSLLALRPSRPPPSGGGGRADGGPPAPGSTGLVIFPPHTPPSPGLPCTFGPPTVTLTSRITLELMMGSLEGGATLNSTSARSAATKARTTQLRVEYKHLLREEEIRLSPGRRRARLTPPLPPLCCLGRLRSKNNVQGQGMLHGAAVSALAGDHRP